MAGERQYHRRTLQHSYIDAARAHARGWCAAPTPGAAPNRFSKSAVATARGAAVGCRVNSVSKVGHGAYTTHLLSCARSEQQQQQQERQQQQWEETGRGRGHGAENRTTVIVSS